MSEITIACYGLHQLQGRFQDFGLRERWDIIELKAEGNEARKIWGKSL